MVRLMHAYTRIGFTGGWKLVVLCAAFVALLCLGNGARPMAAQSAPEAGTVYSWGSNTAGELGDGSNDSQRTLPAPVGNLSGMTTIAGGGGDRGSFSLGLKGDGTVWAWGKNFYGQLGDGTYTNRNVPTRVAGLSNVKDIAAGRYHGLALEEDGTVWAWGHGYFGQLGSGAGTFSSNVPARVEGLSGVVEIAAGGYYSLALEQDGTVWAWGRNYAGELGDGTTKHKYAPVRVAGLTNVKDISAGGIHGMALEGDGTVWTWGSNLYGQLGDGTYANSNVPVRVPNLTGVTDVAAGSYHSVALLEDGTVRAWGDNGYGQVGDGTNTRRNSPVQVTDLGNVTDVEAGQGHNLALRADGTLMAWGLNTCGQLGNTSVPMYNVWNPQSNVPVPVENLSNVTSVSTGYAHSLALVGNAPVSTTAGDPGPGATASAVRAEGDATTFSEGTAPTGPGRIGDDQLDRSPAVDGGASEARTPGDPHRIIVKFEENASRADRADIRRDENLLKKEELDLVGAEVALVEGRPVGRAIRDLERRPEIEYAEPDFRLQPTDYADEPRFGELWGLDNAGQAINGSPGVADVDVNAKEAASVTRGDPNLVVAVIDTGVDFSHPDLADRRWVNPGESGVDANGKDRATNGVDDDANGYVDDVNGWDFFHDDNTVHDPFEDAHGTHVAGTIAGSADGRGIVGVAPNVKVASLKFLGPGGGYTSDAIDAVEYAKRMGFRISNNSWGCASGNCFSQALEDAIRNSGQLFVAAAGNDASDIDTTPSYPASYDLPNVLTVAAVNNAGDLARFSNYGASSVDISAPGVDVLSSVPSTPDSPALALTSVGTSGKVLTAGFGLDEIGDGASDAAAQTSFIGRALESVGGDDRQVVLVDDDLSQDGYRDVGPAYGAAIESATGSPPQVVDVPFGSDGPALSRLQGKTVVWATGAVDVSEQDDFRISSSALTAADQKTLTDFLDGGGRLVLMGCCGLTMQSGVYRTWNYGFVHEVLKLEVTGKNTGGFAGLSNTPFDGESFKLSANLATTSEAEPYHSLLTPVDPAAVTQGVYPGAPASWEYYSGTSMAAPHATGTAALAATANPDLLNDPIALREVVMDSGKPLPGTPTVTSDMVDARAAVAKATDYFPLKAPTIDLDASSDTGVSDTDDLTRDATPTVSGGAGAGTNVQVYDGTNLLGAVTADSAGSWSFTPTGALADGEHGLRAVATDAENNQSPPSATLAITVDTVKPSGTVQINGGGAFVAGRKVTLDLGAGDPPPGSGVYAVSTSNDGVTWSAWTTLSEKEDWTLSSGDGLKTVYVRYRDRTHNVSAKAKDTILLDTRAPQGTVSINGGDARTRSRAVVLALSASDPTPSSGLGEMRFSNNGTTWSSWNPYEKSAQWSLSPGAGDKTVYAQYRDRARNISPIARDSISFSP
jgi:alpha-tubulin suppressor-like RCC1 family protein/subtilisin family serine protease